MEILGYHGTTADAAMAMCQMEFKYEYSDFHWLGNGLYFFQDAPYRAWEWTETYLRNKKKVRSEEPAVVGVVIELDSEEFLDLLDIRWVSIIVEEYHYQLQHREQAGVAIPEQKSIQCHLENNGKIISAPHRLDCDIIDTAADVLKDRGVNIRAARAAFIEGDAIFEGSHLYDRAHVQVAVRDTSIIKDCFPVQKPRNFP
jgi:hypothetical protein